MGYERPTKYMDVLRDDEWDDLARVYEETEAAPDPEPVPPGTYEVHLVHGKLIRSAQKGTRGYRLTFEVMAGEHRGRRIWDTSWLTTDSMPQAKRKLAPLGIHSLHQLEQPVPENLFCKVKVTIRREDDGSQWNRVLTISDVARQPEYDRTIDEGFKEELRRIQPEGMGA